MPPVNQCSLYSVFLEVIGLNQVTHADMRLSCATGCLYQDSGQVYLVSNYHVFAGRNSETGELMGFGGTPVKVKVYFLMDSSTLHEHVADYSLVDSDENPIWQEHPEAGVDVSALPITPPPGIAHFFLNEIETAPGLGRDFFRVNQEVSVIGFPFSLRANGKLPIWKRSVIASEPFSEFSENPRKILIDTASRPGMSGSPVIFAASNTGPVLFDGRKLTVDMPSVKIALGIYSGRIAGADELAAQIGIVWTMPCVQEVVRNPRTQSTAAQSTP